MLKHSPQRTFAGLYIILDPSINPGRGLGEVMTDAASAGARLFQYRNKTWSMREAYHEALALRRRASELGVLFLVNDRCDLALAVDADGVHLGQTDLPYPYARTIMGSDKFIGLSTHTAHQVRQADQCGPDYIGFGPIYTPASKLDHDPVVGLDALRQVRSLTSLPIFGIGGIQAAHARDVMEAGADGIAVISAVLTASDVKETVRDLVARMAQSDGQRR